MLWYHKELKLLNGKQLCFHAISTQQKITIYKESHLSPVSDKVITDVVENNGKDCNPNIEEKIKKVEDIMLENYQRAQHIVGY